jgi:hypothetical protein
MQITSLEFGWQLTLQTVHSRASAPTGNMFQDLPQLCENTDNNKQYIYPAVRVTYTNTLKFNW